MCDPIPLTQHVLWLDKEDFSCFLAPTRACSLARYSLPFFTLLHLCAHPVPAYVRVTCLVMTANRGTSWTSRSWTVLLAQTARDVHTLQRI